MMSMAFLISSLTSTAATAQTVGYTFILMGFVFQVILSSQYGALIDLLFSDNVASWVIVVRWILTFYPPFFFSKGFYDIVAKASPEISMAAGKVIQGPGFWWSDLYATRHITLFRKFPVTVPPTVEAFYYLLATIALYTLLALYFDAVLPGDHGTTRHPLFCIGGRSWPCFRKKKQSPSLLQTTPVDTSGTSRLESTAFD